MTDTEEHPEDEEAALICSLRGQDDPLSSLREQGDRVIVQGSIEETCERCGKDIWLAPTGQALRVQHDAKLICTTCGFDVLQKPDVKVQAPTKEQMDEVKDAIRREFM